MPRVKHIMKGKDVIRAWLEQSQDWARTPSGSVSFKGDIIFDGNFEEFTEDKYDYHCCGRRWVMPNGDIVFTYHSLPHYRSYSSDGYSGMDMLVEYCNKYNCIRFESYRCFDILDALTRAPYFWISSPKYTTINSVCNSLKYSVDFMLRSRAYASAWRLSKPDYEKYSGQHKSAMKVLFEDKVTMEDVISSVYEYSLDAKQKEYEDAGQGNLIAAIHTTINSCAAQAGVQIANAYPSENDGRKIKLSAKACVRTKTNNKNKNI